MHRVQEPELFVDEEQKDHYRAHRAEEVLPPLPQTSAASGNQVK
jgi:hypothetical protein